MNDKVTADCSKKEISIRPSDMILEIGKTRDALVKVLDIDEDNALEKAIKFVGDFYGFTMDYVPVKKDNFVLADDYIKFFPQKYTSAEIAKQLGMKTRKVNRRLVKIGFLYRFNDGVYRLTNEGKKHGCRNVDDEGVEEILWDEDVIDILTDSFISD